jgi:3-hydroxybutyryl-CoA dehydratase
MTYYDNFIIGFKGSYIKNVTEKDNILFADISGDHNPVHFQDDVAEDAGFEGKISNGFVTESRIAAALVETFGSESTLVVALEKRIRFLKPVYMDDEITATVEVVERLEPLQMLRIKAECHNGKKQRVIAAQFLIKIVDRQ